MSKTISPPLTEEQIIRHAITKSGKNAYITALRKGVAVTVLNGNKIQRVHPNGIIEIIRSITKPNNRVASTRIKLK